MTDHVMSHRERCVSESTRDVIFLLRYKLSARASAWHVDSVWLDRGEAEAFRQSHLYRWRVSQVYGVCANGALAQLLKSDMGNVFLNESEATHD